MPPSSSSDLRKLWSLAPFVYTVTTRLGTMRDFGYLVATTWLPGVWVLVRLGGHDPAAAVLYFVAGYLAFISLYEIGYLVNDIWDAPRNEHGRGRVSFDHDVRYVAAFVIARVALWTAISIALGWIAAPLWLAGFAALAVVFTAHNLVQRPAFRVASFYQLACLRFSLPVIGEIHAAKVILLLFIGAVFYAYLRFLGYLDSKRLLAMEDRRRADFGLVQMLLLAPLIAFAAYASGEGILLELLVYYTAIYGGYAVFARG